VGKIRGESITYSLATYLDDLDDALVDAFGVQQAGEVAVQALVAAHELIRER
jgi:hypothetical protein